MVGKKTMRGAAMALGIMLGTSAFGLAVRTTAASAEEVGGGTTFSVSDVVKTVTNTDDTWDAFVAFDKDISDAAAENLQDMAAYQETVYVNGTPIETFEGCSMSFESVTVSSMTYMALKLHLDTEALDWTIAYGEAKKHLYANEIVIKEGFPSMSEGVPSQTDGLDADSYLYSGQEAPKLTANKPSYKVRTDVFYKGFRNYYETAFEGWLMSASCEDDAEANKYRISVTIGSGFIFHKTVKFNNVMRRDMNAVDYNFFRTESRITKSATALEEASGQTSVSLYAIRTGLRYSLGRLLTVNGMCLADWLDLPLDAAVQAGITDNEELLAFVNAFGEDEARKEQYSNVHNVDMSKMFASNYEAMGDVYLNGSQLIIELPKSGSQTVGDKTVIWQTPDMSGDIEISFQPGFAGKTMRFTETTKAIYEADNGSWTFAEDGADPVEFKPIKIKSIEAPVYTDAPDNNFTLRFVFDAKASVGEQPYFSQSGAWLVATPAASGENYTAELIAQYEKYDIQKSARDCIVFGAVFAGESEFRTYTLGEMIESTMRDGGTKTDGQKANSATLHYAGGADARLSLPYLGKCWSWDYVDDTQTEIYYKDYVFEQDADGEFILDGNGKRIVKELFRAKDENGNDLFDEEGNQVIKEWVTNNRHYIDNLNQNFTITFKAGFRTPTGYEIKEDQSFIYDPVSAKWYEGTDINAIVLAQLQPLIESIEKLPAPDALTLADELYVVQARNSYDQLSEDRKALINNYEKLTAAEERMAVLKEEAARRKGCSGSFTGGGIAFGCIALAGVAIAVSRKTRREEK